MNPGSVDIKSLIVSAGAGVDGLTSPSTRWSVHIPNFPQELPDECICIRDSGGSEEYLLDDTRIDDPGFQVVVRAKTYSEGWAKTSEIKNAVGMRGSVSVNGTLYWRIISTTNVLFLEIDERNRFIFSWNGSIRRTDS